MMKISDKILKNWQKIVNIMAKTINVSVSLITEVDKQYIELIKTNESNNNPFKEGDKLKLTGYYCARVIKQQKMIEVNNIFKDLKDREGIDDLDLNGLISYLGYPIMKPDGNIFGTICVLDKKERVFTSRQKELLYEFKIMIENQLENIHLNIINQATKDKLQKTLSRYKMAINGANLGLWDWNIKTGKTKYKDRWADMLGYEPKEIENDLTYWENLIHEDDKDRVFQKLENHLLGETGCYQSEHRLKTKDGSWKWIYDMGKVVEYDNEGNPARAVGIHQDIDDRKRTEKIITKHKAYFQQLFDKSPEAIALLDNDERIVKINDSFEEIFEYKSFEIKGKKINDLVVPDKKKKEAEKISKKIKSGHTYTAESIRKTKSGQEIYVNIKGYPITIENERLGIYIIYDDITDRKKEEKHIRYLSYHDQLTELYNRRYFESILERLNKTRKLPVSIIIGDIDDLKKVNDRLGHKEGDKYIKKTAQIINTVIRREDLAARIGGDEFAIILPDTDKDIAEKIIQRILDECKEENNINNINLSISLGYSVKTSYEQDINEVYKLADINMYENKEKKTDN